MKWIKTETVRKEVKKIEKESWDNEAAHADEDELYYRVLKQVAMGNPHSQELAKEALKTQKIDFSRWYA